MYMNLFITTIRINNEKVDINDIKFFSNFYLLNQLNLFFVWNSDIEYIFNKYFFGNFTIEFFPLFLLLKILIFIIFLYYY